MPEYMCCLISGGGDMWARVVLAWVRGVCDRKLNEGYVSHCNTSDA